MNDKPRSKNMKIAYLPLIAAISIVLSACSNSPTDSDVKNAIVNELGISNCKRFEVDNFKKLNGIAGNDGRTYEVDISYSLRIQPLPDVNAIIKSLEKKHADEDLALQSAINKFSETEKKYGGFVPPSSEAGAIQKYFQQETDVNSLKSKVTQRDGIDNSIVADKYLKDCPTINERLGASLYDYDLYHEKKDWFIRGVNKNISQTVRLIKSDNGWVVR